MTQILKNSIFLNNNFDIDVFYIKAVSHAENRGVFAFRNIFLNIQNTFNFVVKFIFHRYDFVYLSIAQNNFGFIRDSIFVLIAKIFKVKVVAQYHAGNFLNGFNRKHKFLKAYIKYIYRYKIDKLIVLANKIKIEFDVFTLSEKIIVLRNFIDDEFIPDKLEKIYNNRNISVCFIGYISVAKGAVDLVKAAKLIIDGLPSYNIQFFLAGDFIEHERNITYINSPHGGHSEIVRYMKANSLEDNIHLLGYIGEDDKIELLKKSDLFVLPSYSEGFPVSILEAMSYGLPIVVTDVGAIGEVLKEGENCLFSIIGEHKNLAELIRKLILDIKLRETMSVNNYNLVKSNFNLKKYENQLLKIFS